MKGWRQRHCCGLGNFPTKVSHSWWFPSCLSASRDRRSSRRSWESEDLLALRALEQCTRCGDVGHLPPQKLAPTHSRRCLRRSPRVKKRIPKGWECPRIALWKVPVPYRTKKEPLPRRWCLSSSWTPPEKSSLAAWPRDFCSRLLSGSQEARVGQPEKIFRRCLSLQGTPHQVLPQ